MKIIFKDNTSQTEEFRVYCENCDSRVKVDILNKLTVSVFSQRENRWFLKKKYISGLSRTWRSSPHSSDGDGKADYHGGKFLLGWFSWEDDNDIDHKNRHSDDFKKTILIFVSMDFFGQWPFYFLVDKLISGNNDIKNIVISIDSNLDRKTSWWKKQIVDF